MGGFGSGKGERYDSRRGKGRRRRYTGEAPYVDLCWTGFKKIDINNPIAELLHPAGGTSLFFKMKPHTLPNTAIWFSFECPVCARGARRLYFDDKGLGCRRCFKLAYRSENLGKTDRAIGMKWKLIQQISRESDESPSRPKGMHHSTYERLMNRISKYNCLSYSFFFRCDKRFSQFQSFLNPHP